MLLFCVLGAAYVEWIQTKWLPVQADLIAVTSATGNPRLELELAKLTHNDESTVMILGSCLPNVIPNVLLNKRDVGDFSSCL